MAARRPFRLHLAYNWAGVVVCPVRRPGGCARRVAQVGELHAVQMLLFVLAQGVMILLGLYLADSISGC